MTEPADRFIRALRAGEPRAVHAVRRLLGTMVRKSEIPLTEGHVEVLERLAHGEREKEIAQQLHLSPEGVRSRLKRARMLLGARNNTHAVVLWLATLPGSDAAHTPPAHQGTGDGECSGEQGRRQAA